MLRDELKLRRKMIVGMMLTLLILSMLTFAFNVQPVISEPATIVVPDDYPTIQEAINAASPGDTIYVYNGTYYENVVVGKSIQLIGEDPATTIIDGSGTGDVIHVTIDNVNITGFTIQYGEIGIRLLYTNHDTISNNIILNHTVGIDLAWSDYNLIVNCSLTNCTYAGIALWTTSANNTYENCNASYSGMGFHVGWGWYNLVKNCKAWNCTQWGIVLDSCDYARVENCDVWFNNAGIVIYSFGTARYNTIIDCDAYLNGIGILAYDPNSPGGYNTIYHNMLVNNTQYQARDDQYYPNEWDNGYPSGGNYWSDYNGTDFYSGPYQNETGSDGIGDTPYVIEDNNQDNYPLIHPYGSIRNLDTNLTYLTIQSAINAPETLDGHTISVSSGTYYEHVTIGKSLILLGEDRETTIIDGGGTGTVVYVSHADYVEISGFTVTKGGVDGIYLWYSNHNKLTDLNVHSNGRHGILTEHSEYVFIANVNTYSNGWHGIRLGWYPNHSVITNCNASFNDRSGIHPSDWPTNVTITNCTASWNGEDGIWLGWTTDGLIKNCTVHDNGRYGILLDTDKYCTVADCYAGSNPEGIRVYIHSSSYIHNTITNCDLESNDRGIIVCHRGGYGIWYLDTTIKNCYIRNNEGGISVGGKGNKIYHNNLIDNAIQASDNGIDNVWDDGYPSGGNYWSDYNGSDFYSGPYQNETGSDSIEDTPYIIDENNQDNYPLVHPYGSIRNLDTNLTYLTIQSAINANETLNGHTILVEAGTYYENVDVYKRLNIYGSGADVTIVSASDPNDHVFKVTTYYVNISGFTVTGATGHWLVTGRGPAGIYLGDQVQYCNISDNTALNNEYGILLGHSSYSNTITNNTASNNEYGIYLYAYSSNNILTTNICENNKRGIYLYEACSFSEDTGNIFRDNILENCGIFIYGYEVSDFNLQVMENNQVNGKPVYYYADETGVVVPDNAGQVILANCSNMTIRNINASHATVGVEMAFTDDSLVENSILSNNVFGIYLHSSSNNTLANNTCLNNSDSSIYMQQYSSNNKLTNNTLSNSINGIYIYNACDNNTLINNTCSNNDYGIYLYYSYNHNLSNNVFENCGIFINSFIVSQSNSHVIENNWVNGKPLYYYADDTGIEVPTDAGQVILANCSNMTIRNLNASNTTVGVQLLYTDDSLVENSILSNNIYGIRLSPSSNSIIKNNTCENNRYGINVWYLYNNYNNNNIISNNTCTNNEYGIYMWRSYNNNIISNTLETADYGLYLYSSNYNSIYHNNFIANANRIYNQNSNNTWDNGYPSGGNYWSNYTGVDNYRGPYQNETGSDGIGDTPVQIDQYNKDNYPVMNRDPWVHDIAIINITLSTTDAYAGQTVEINATAKNRGTRYESFNVTIYYDNTDIGTQQVSMLAPGENVTLAFTWNTTDVGGGYYTISASASIVPEETNTTNNILTDGTIKITSPVRIVEVTPCNQTGSPKDTFELGTMAYFKVTINNTATVPQDALITINLYDNTTVTIGVASFQGPILPGTSTIIFGLPITTTATIGTATVYANAYTDWPHLGGFPHCPETSATLEITGP